MTEPDPDATHLLAAHLSGDPDAASELLPLVYAELRELAGRQMRRERGAHTLQATALVHEAFLRLVGQDRVDWQGRTHFLAMAAETVRRVLVDHARARAARRGGEPQPPVPDSARSDVEDPAAAMRRAEALLELGLDEEALDIGFAALERAEEGAREALEARYQVLEQRVARATSAAGIAAAEERIAALRAERDPLAEIVDVRRDWQFPDDEEDARWWHNQLVKLVEGLEALSDAETGLLGTEALSPTHGWSMPKRLAFARESSSAHGAGGALAARWQAAAPEIEAAYPGLELDVEPGLVPIGPDPESGLWEFWHVQSGAEPTRDRAGRLELTEETGLVLVLLPGGAFTMGAQRSDPRAPNFDPDAKESEAPVHEVTLTAFFLSKYELTQAQWLRATGQNPSHWYPGGDLPGATLRHPVEQVDWNLAREVLERMGLALPSEAQWEYGCRAGTGTPYSCAWEELFAHANVTDQAYERAFEIKLLTESWNDGFAGPAPVGSLAPNAWGLHDMHGNVWEWCADGYAPDSYVHGRDVDPVVPWQHSATRVIRGGGFTLGALQARSAHRYIDAPTSGSDSLGIRAARAIRR